MLDGYFVSSEGIEKKKRIIAVQAALEIVKASVSASCAYAGRDKLSKDMEATKEKISELADAIQAAIEKQ